jgi:UDP-N-acetylglucosamine--N-acetylmuramyl-(pentapeptide) pyrophosphoryl-undecaprenol N-acetylglucosamine transferase
VDAFEKEDVRVVWQTGRLYYEHIRQELDPRQLQHVQYFDFINRMDMAYCVADIIVSRAGAATISELCLLGKPAILIPSPNVAEDHQTKNAMALVGNNAAIMIPDKEVHEKLVAETIALLNNSSLRSTLSQNCRQMALTDSAKKIVNEIFNLVRER